MPGKKKEIQNAINSTQIKAWIKKVRGKVDAYDEAEGDDHECALGISAQRDLLNNLEKVLDGKVGPTEEEFAVTMTVRVIAESEGEAHSKVHFLLVKLQNESLDADSHELLMATEVGS